MSDLVKFLRARLDDDEQAARAASPSPWREPDGSSELESLLFTREDAYHIYRWEPSRVLADVEAKRRIIVEYEKEARVMEQGHRTAWTEGGQAARETTLKLLALPYDWHPHYDEAWRPGS